MPSLEAHLASWILRSYLKPRLAATQDVERVRRLMTTLPPIPNGVRVSSGSVGSVPGEWVEGGETHSTLLYLHGGGYLACSPQTHRPITCAFARMGFRVFAPAYRLAPEHIFPAALEDACAAYRSLLAEIPSGIVVAGDSAGGGLALAMMLALRDQRVPLPAAAALFSPWTDLAATGLSLVKNDDRCAMFRGSIIGPTARYYLGDADPCNPLASPLYGDLRGLPPLLIHASADEVLLDDSTRLAERALAAGVAVELKVWPVVFHVWQLAGRLMPEARQSMREAGAFLKSAVEAGARAMAGSHT